MRRRDWIVLIAVAALAGILLGVGALSRAGETAGRHVFVYVDGELYATATLGVDREIRVEQPGGQVNVIRLTEDGFYMESANCHNQLCIRQGQVTRENFPRRALGTHVLCLPNRVDVELELTDADDLSEATDV